MSEKVLTATPDGEPNKNTQKIDADAFAREFADADIDTKAVIADEARIKEENKKLEKLAEMNQFLEDAKDRRRGLQAIYGTDIVNDMSDAEIEAFISEKLDDRKTPTETPATAEIETGETHEQQLPTDAELHDIVGLEEDAPVLGFRARIMDKMGLVKGAGFGANFVLGMSQLAGRRAEKQAKLEQKIAAMSPEEKKKYLRRNRVISALSAAAIGAGLYAARTRGLWDGDSPLQGAPKGTGDMNIALAGEKRDLTGVNADDSKANIALANEKRHLDYNNSDSSFYDFARKEHRGDFGPPLIADADRAKDTIDGKYNPGFNDWMNRHKHDPNGLGNLRVGLGLEGGDTSFAHRNQIADHFNRDVKAHSMMDAKTLEALKDPKQFSIETVSIDQPYTSTYMTDVNGDPVIGVQKHVDYGGEAFKIKNEKTGEITYWRKNCGGDQQIWLEPRVAPAPQAPVGNVYYEQPGYSQPIQPVSYSTPPQGGGEGTPPPVRPPRETPPTTPPPSGPPPTTPPPVTPPTGGKGNAYPANPFVAPLESGPLRELPDAVEEFIESIPDRSGIDQPPIIDNFLTPRGGETGGLGAGDAPSLDTGINPGGGGIQGAETPSTNNGNVNSTL